jgi:hypothetical protein
MSIFGLMILIVKFILALVLVAGGGCLAWFVTCVIVSVLSDFCGVVRRLS